MHYFFVAQLYKIQRNFRWFLTASYASLAVQGIAFRQEQVVEFAQILEYFVMYFSRIISYQFKTSLDMFVWLLKVLGALVEFRVLGALVETIV